MAELGHFYPSTLSRSGTSIMRRMKTRQAILFINSILLLITLSACSTSNELTPTQTAIPATLTPTPTMTFTPSPVPATSTPTPLTCLTESGEVKQGAIPETIPSQEFLIYMKTTEHLRTVSIVPSAASPAVAAGPYNSVLNIPSYSVHSACIPLQYSRKTRPILKT